ncbi:MAG: NAD(P)H-dependent oxidoreductase [Thermomicrobiales bacterium]
MRVAAIVSSLRQGPYDQALYRSALELAPASSRLVELSIGDLPYYPPDVDQPAKAPVSAETFRAGMRSADTLLTVTPEYNHSLPGVLKNALDWASRP